MNGMFVTLVKREFWESKALWIAPLVVAGLLLTLTVIGAVFAQDHLNFRGPNLYGPGQFSPPNASAIHKGLMGLSAQMFVISALVCAFYLLDCLFAERKDRSILFWKSLPVSDAHTVLAKYTVAMLIVPAGVFVLASITYVLMFAIALLGMPHFAELIGGWKFNDWLQAEGWILGTMAVTLLWYAPLMAWNMLASVLARRSPIMLATLPIVALGICESILVNTGYFWKTAYIWKFVGHRFLPIMDPAEGIQRPELWIGLAVTVGMLYMVIRLRRYRDDT